MRCTPAPAPPGNGGGFGLRAGTLWLGRALSFSSHAASTWMVADGCRIGGVVGFFAAIRGV